MSMDVISSLKQVDQKSLLRFTTAGSVDDGKSTLIGRLLLDTKNVPEDVIDDLKQKNKSKNEFSDFDISYLTDGLKAEREQKITIDVAYRYFSTSKRKFILADTPGHEQYTRNMATGASTANAALVLIDAKKGVSTQTKRHAFIADLLGIKHILVTINKMDSVDYSESRFNQIKTEFELFAAKLNISDIRFVPVSALVGCNVVTRSKHTPWYEGQTVLQYLEDLYVESDRNLVDFRFPVQLVCRPNDGFRGFSGTIASGVIKKDAEVLALPSHQRAKIKKVIGVDGEVTHAFSGQAVTLELDCEIDLGRGDMLVFPNNLPAQADEFEIMAIWMSSEPMSFEKTYIFKHTTNSVKGKVSELRYGVDVNSLHRTDDKSLELNKIGRAQVRLHSPLYVDGYRKNRTTGSLIIIDPISNNTVGVGMIMERRIDSVGEKKPKAQVLSKTLDPTLQGRAFREKLLDQKAMTYWLTGLSGSGKSTIARAMEQKLNLQGKLCYVLDGDELRTGLCKGLGFSQQDREESIRRVAELAKTLNQAGVIVIAALISPLKQQRQQAREIIGTTSFFEIFVDTPLEICESRDPKGLYKKARTGEIAQFTGISSAYEIPEEAELKIKTEEMSAEASAEYILSRSKQELGGL